MPPKTVVPHDFRQTLDDWKWNRQGLDLERFGRWAPCQRAEFLIALLWDQNPEVHFKALELLGSLAPEEANQTFLDMATQGDESLFSMTRLYELLGDYKDVRNVEVLVNVVSYDPNPDHRIAAVYGLGKIGGPSTLPLLKSIAQSDHEHCNDPWRAERVSDAAKIAIQEIESLQ